MCRFETIVIPELRNTKSLSTDQQKEREADLILKALQPGDYIVLLDEHGKEFTSMQFAAYLEKKMANVARRLVSSWGAPTDFPTASTDGSRKDFALEDDLFAPDDSPHLHRTTLPGHDYSQQRTLSSR